jgi:hypothetical protein
MHALAASTPRGSEHQSRLPDLPSGPSESLLLPTSVTAQAERHIVPVHAGSHFRRGFIYTEPRIAVSNRGRPCNREPPRKNSTDPPVDAHPRRHVLEHRGARVRPRAQADGSVPAMLCQDRGHPHDKSDLTRERCLKHRGSQTPACDSHTPVHVSRETCGGRSCHPLRQPVSRRSSGGTPPPRDTASRPCITRDCRARSTRRSSAARSRPALSQPLQVDRRAHGQSAGPGVGPTRLPQHTVARSAHGDRQLDWRPLPPSASADQCTSGDRDRVANATTMAWLRAAPAHEDPASSRTQAGRARRKRAASAPGMTREKTPTHADTSAAVTRKLDVWGPSFHDGAIADRRMNAFRRRRA